MRCKGTQVTTGKVRMNYVNLEVPRAYFEGEEAKYSVTVLIPKTEGQIILEIGEALDDAARMGEQKWGAPFGEVKIPLRDGDVERPQDKAYAGHYFFKASSLYKPLLIDEAKQEVRDTTIFYSGCYGRAVVRFFPYEAGAQRGIGCQLLGVQKLSEGQRLTTHGITLQDFDSAWED